MGEHRRGHSSGSIAAANLDQNQQGAQQQDEDLALFHEMSSKDSDDFLHRRDDIEDSLAKFGKIATCRIETKPSTDKGRDFLESEPEKSEYDWLLTPPATPLFPSFEDAPATASVENEGNKMPSNIRTTDASRPRRSPSPASRRNASPTARSSFPSCSSSPNAGKSSAPVRHSSPSSAAAAARPSRPSSPRAATRSSSPALARPSSSTVARPSSPRVARPASPEPCRPTSPASQRSSATPTRRSVTPGGSLGNNPTKSVRSGSPARKSKSSVHLAMAGMSTEQPPNLRTSIDRPSSNQRGSLSPKAANKGKAASPGFEHQDRSRRAVSPSLSRSSSTSSSKSGSVISSQGSGVEVNCPATPGLNSISAKRPTLLEVTSPKPRAVRSPGSSRRPFETSPTSASKLDFKKSANGFRPLMSNSHISSFYSRASTSLMQRSVQSTTDSSLNSSVQDSDPEDEVLSGQTNCIFGDKAMECEEPIVREENENDVEKESILSTEEMEKNHVPEERIESCSRDSEFLSGANTSETKIDGYKETERGKETASHLKVVEVRDLARDIAEEAVEPVNRAAESYLEDASMKECDTATTRQTESAVVVQTDSLDRRDIDIVGEPEVHIPEDHNNEQPDQVMTREHLQLPSQETEEEITEKKSIMDRAEESWGQQDDGSAKDQEKEGAACLLENDRVIDKATKISGSSIHATDVSACGEAAAMEGDHGHVTDCADVEDDLSVTGALVMATGYGLGDKEKTAVAIHEDSSCGEVEVNCSQPGQASGEEELKEALENEVHAANLQRLKLDEHRASQTTVSIAETEDDVQCQEEDKLSEDSIHSKAIVLHDSDGITQARLDQEATTTRDNVFGIEKVMERTGNGVVAASTSMVIKENVATSQAVISSEEERELNRKAEPSESVGTLVDLILDEVMRIVEAKKPVNSASDAGEEETRIQVVNVPSTEGSQEEGTDHCLSELLSPKYSSSLMEVYQFDQQLQSKVSEVETIASSPEQSSSSIVQDPNQYCLREAARGGSSFKRALRDTIPRTYSPAKRRDYSRGSSSYFSLKMQSSKGGGSISSRPFSTDESRSTVDTPRSLQDQDEDDSKSEESYVDYYIVAAGSDMVEGHKGATAVHEACDIPEAAGSSEMDNEEFVDYYIDDMSSSRAKEQQDPSEAGAPPSSVPPAPAAASTGKLEQEAPHRVCDVMEELQKAQSQSNRRTLATAEDDEYDSMVECWKQQEEACLEMEQQPLSVVEAQESGAYFICNSIVEEIIQAAAESKKEKPVTGSVELHSARMGSGEAATEELGMRRTPAYRKDSPAAAAAAAKDGIDEHHFIDWTEVASKDGGVELQEQQKVKARCRCTIL